MGAPVYRYRLTNTENSPRLSVPCTSACGSRGQKALGKRSATRFSRPIPILSIACSFSSGNAGTNSIVFAFNTPSGTGLGDLLIVVVSVKGDAGSFTMPADWNTLTTQTSSNVSLGIGWKNADASEPASHTVSWSSANYVYGWIMKFSSHDPSNPIHGFDFTIGPSASSQPNAPTILTTVDNTLILRIGGFNGGSITADDTGLQDYQTITMDASGTNVSAGAGYATQANSTSTGTAKFSLTQSQYWIAVTLAIAPSN